MAACAGCGKDRVCGCCAGARCAEPGWQGCPQCRAYGRAVVPPRRSGGALDGHSVWIADPELGERPICLCPSRRDADAIAAALGQAYQIRTEVRQ